MARRIPFTRWLALGAFAMFAVFWTWALFFASKESVNRIGDDAWRARSEQLCATAATQRESLADYTLIRESDGDAIAKRADLVDQATDTLDTMLNEIESQPPTDEKGQHIVPLWIADYRTYVADRRSYTEQLRTTGENLAFYETKAGRLPITERIATFANDNVMPSCVPPRDVSS